MDPVVAWRENQSAGRRDWNPVINSQQRRLSHEAGAWRTARICDDSGTMASALRVRSEARLHLQARARAAGANVGADFQPEIDEALRYPGTISELTLATKYGEGSMQIPQADSYSFTFAGEKFFVTKPGVNVSLVMDLQVDWDPASDPGMKNPSLVLHSGVLLSGNEFQRSSLPGDAFKYLLIDHWPGQMSWRGCNNKAIALYEFLDVTVQRDFGGNTVPVSALTDAVNGLTELDGFKCKDCVPMPTGNTNCLHSALTLTRSLLGDAIPDYNDYIMKKEYFTKDVQEAWLRQNPEKAHLFGH